MRIASDPTATVRHLCKGPAVTHRRQLAIGAVYLHGRPSSTDKSSHLHKQPLEPKNGLPVDAPAGSERCSQIAIGKNLKTEEEGKLCPECVRLLPIPPSRLHKKYRRASRQMGRQSNCRIQDWSALVCRLPAFG